VVSRRIVVATGIVVLGLYAALAMVSGNLSPLARGPLLDGIGPPQPYRWVNPPPDLAAANLPPSSGSFHVPLDPNGSRAEVFVTSDNQVTVIVPQGSFDPKPGQIEVTLSVTPLDPATLPSPGTKLTIFGNAYRLKAVYQPSGATAPLALPLDVVLLYPVTTNLHASLHQLYVSPDKQTWAVQEGSDSIAQQQAEGPMRTLGYVVVAGKAGTSTITPSPSATGSSGSSTAIVLIVLAACIGLIGLGLLVRGRGERGETSRRRR
jgi:hypothetical protein